jgi:hypothetical protein
MLPMFTSKLTAKAARVVGAAQIALWLFEARDFDAAQRFLKAALDEHNLACHAYLSFVKDTSSSSRKENHVA